jgi:hypothetical protein
MLCGQAKMMARLVVKGEGLAAAFHFQVVGPSFHSSLLQSMKTVRRKICAQPPPTNPPSLTEQPQLSSAHVVHAPCPRVFPKHEHSKLHTKSPFGISRSNGTSIAVVVPFNTANTHFRNPLSG